MPEERFSLRGRGEALVLTVCEVLEEKVKEDESQYESDASLWMMAISLIAGFLTSVAANQVPSISTLFGKGTLNRADLHNIQDMLEKVEFKADLEVNRDAILKSVKDVLSDRVDDSKKVSEEVFLAIESKLKETM